MAEAEKGERQDGIVSLQTLGRIKAIDKNSEPLIASINGNDEIEVHPINDYMPSVFKQTYLKQS